MTLQPHNLKAASLWDAGGAAYDRISATIADAIEHAVIRLDPRPGERVLDVATGTGWGARRLAARGARVTGVDLGADLIEAAGRLAKEAGASIDFRVGDAEKLAFEDGSFDAVLSTFGVMFAGRPEAAAAELARVTKPGGRLVVAAWTPTSTIAGFFAVMKPYLPPPPSPAPPAPWEWGRRERAQELLGGSFELKFETAVSVLYHASGRSVWELFASAYGPTKTLVGTLDEARREQLQRDFAAYHDRFRTELGVAMPREYLLIHGVRKG